MNWSARRPSFLLETSVGWFNYSDEEIAGNVADSVARGFTAMKLKVGSPDINRDVRRLRIIREAAGPDATIMADANQQWTIDQAVAFHQKSKDLDLFWLEEPTHSDDILAHKTIADAIAPVKVAAGEHVANRMAFKNYFQCDGMAICQVDALRVAGVSEFLAISLMARQFDVPVIPHVGDMGQLHQHLVLFNHIALNHPALFLETIPHLKEHFAEPARVKNGVYQTPLKPGLSCDLNPE